MEEKNRCAECGSEVECDGHTICDDCGKIYSEDADREMVGDDAGYFDGDIGNK